MAARTEIQSTIFASRLCIWLPAYFIAHRAT